MINIKQNGEACPGKVGRRPIGEVAGHKINLEIEGVQDKIK